MFKIIQQVTNEGILTNRYTLSLLHNNKVIWSVTNLTEQGVAELMVGRSDEQLNDTDFAFSILKTNAGPVLLATTGELIPQPVRSKHAHTQSKSHPWNNQDTKFKTRKRIVSH